MGRYLLFSLLLLSCSASIAQRAFDLLVENGYEALREGRLSEARSGLEKALREIPAGYDAEETAILYNNLGVVHYQLGDYKKGIDLYNIALGRYRKLGNDTLVAQSLLNLGLAYKEIGALDRAMKELVTAARIFEQNGMGKELSACWNAMGNIQREMENFPKALDYQQKALEIREKIGYKKGVADSYHNLGMLYLVIHRLDMAEEYLLEGLRRKQELGNEWNTLTTLTLLGQLYLEKDQPGKAFAYLNEAYGLRLASDSPRIASSLYFLGTYYVKEGDLKKAKASFSRAAELARISEESVLLESILRAEIGLPGMTDRVLVEKYSELLTVHERVAAEGARKEIARLEIAYGVERKDREIQMRKKQVRIRQIELENQRLQSRQLSSWLIATLALLALMITAWYLLRRSNSQIRSQNVLLEEQKQEITSLHHELSHRTSNYFSMLSGILKSDRSTVTNPETVKVLDENIRRVQAMSLIQRFLMRDDTRRNSEVRLDSYLSSLVDQLMLGLSSKATLHLDLEPVYFDYDISMRLAIVLNELVSNAIEHGLQDAADPELHITVRKQRKKIVMTVKDNGMGMPAHRSADSKGLQLVEKLLRKIDGTIAFRNEGGCVAQVTVEK